MRERKGEEDDSLPLSLSDLFFFFFLPLITTGEWESLRVILSPVARLYFDVQVESGRREAEEEVNEVTSRT